MKTVGHISDTMYGICDQIDKLFHNSHDEKEKLVGKFDELFAVLKKVEHINRTITGKIREDIQSFDRHIGDATRDGNNVDTEGVNIINTLNELNGNDSIEKGRLADQAIKDDGDGVGKVFENYCKDNLGLKVDRTKAEGIILAVQARAEFVKKYANFEEEFNKENNELNDLFDKLDSGEQGGEQGGGATGDDDELEKKAKQLRELFKELKENLKEFSETSGSDTGDKGDSGNGNGNGNDDNAGTNSENMDALCQAIDAAMNISGINGQLSGIYNGLEPQDKEKVDKIAEALKSCNTSSEE